MAMGHNTSGSITAVLMTKAAEHQGMPATQTHHCSAPPSSLEASALSASSPNSVSSTLSSSMSELYTPTGLINEAGHSSTLSENEAGDSTSTAGRYNFECPSSTSLDCGHVSCASDIPSPIVEEDPGMSMNEVDVDLISEDFNLDVKPCLDGACFSDTYYRQDSSRDEMFMSGLDVLLQSDAPQEFVGESGPACVDDLFPSLGMGQDFTLLDGINTWSVESLRELESLPFPEEEIVQAQSAIYDGEEESASQMFTQWLRNNAHWISLSDLCKIKLKTSTIESATSQLGGGKKGLMLFLKFVLMWVQNSQMKRPAPEKSTPAAVVSSSAMQSKSSPGSGFQGTSAMAMEGGRRRDGLPALESSCVGQGSGAHALSGPSSTLSHIAAAPSCPDWMTRAQWMQTQTLEHNPSISVPISYASKTNAGAGSPLPSPNFCRANSAWPHHSNMMRGVSPSMASPSLRSPANGSNGRTGGAAVGDAASMMMLMQQQHCSDATPAATTRAARKSRMERQRWSVRHSRKWSAAAHKSQHLLAAAAAASSGGVHGNLRAWSQVLENSSQILPYSSSRGCPQRLGGRSTMECQQSKKPERDLRLLFRKELKQSDVGSLGRIVLPKAAETCLPPLELRDGMNLVVEDMNSSKVWNMRYRFWPNNRSRMYLLENTSDFVKSYDLKEGDYMMLLCDNLTGRFVIRGAKGPGQAAVLTGPAVIEDMSDAALFYGAKKKVRLPKEEAGAMNSEESGDDNLLAELIEQSLEDLKESSETEFCDCLEPI